MRNGANRGAFMVGLGRLELPTPALSERCSNQLSYRPMNRGKVASRAFLCQGLERAIGPTWAGSKGGPKRPWNRTLETDGETLPSPTDIDLTRAPAASAPSDGPAGIGDGRR